MIRYTLKLFTAGQEADGVHSVHDRLTQWKPVPDAIAITWPVPLVTVIVPMRSPPCVGVNVTLIVHDAPPPSDAGQVFVCP